MTSSDRYCKHCAERIDPSMAFCPSCGSRIVWVTPEELHFPDGSVVLAKDSGPYVVPPGTFITQEFLAEQQKAKELADAKNSAYYGCGILVAIAFFVVMYVVFGYR